MEKKLQKNGPDSVSVCKVTDISGASNILGASVTRVKGDEYNAGLDYLAVEEPFSIQISFGPENKRQTTDLAITMRTPGSDPELAIGFLFSEGIIRDSNDILSIHQFEEKEGKISHNQILIELDHQLKIDPDRFQRNFLMNSSCGLCGKASLESIKALKPGRIPRGKPFVSANLLHHLPKSLKENQKIFGRTGGLHAAALFDLNGKLTLLREDIGRHNALDKLIGAAFESKEIPLHQSILLLSGRLSFELVQKAILSGIPVIASVGAPSSLAVEVGKKFGLSLIGFLRNDRYNIYCGRERILIDEALMQKT